MECAPTYALDPSTNTVVELRSRLEVTPFGMHMVYYYHRIPTTSGSYLQNAAPPSTSLPPGFPSAFTSTIPWMRSQRTIPQHPAQGGHMIHDPSRQNSRMEVYRSHTLPSERVSRTTEQRTHPYHSSDIQKQTYAGNRAQAVDPRREDKYACLDRKNTGSMFRYYWKADGKNPAATGKLELLGVEGTGTTEIVVVWERFPDFKSGEEKYSCLERYSAKKVRAAIDAGTWEIRRCT